MLNEHHQLIIAAKHGLDPYYHFDSMETLLHFVCSIVNLNFVRYLIESVGFHEEAKNIYGEAPVHYSIRNNQYSVIKYAYRRI